MNSENRAYSKPLKYSTFLKLCRVLKAMAGDCGISKERLMGSDYLDCRESAFYDWLKLLDETFPGALRRMESPTGMRYFIDSSKLSSIKVPRALDWEEQVVLAYVLKHRPQFLPAGFDQAVDRLDSWLGDRVPALEELFYVSPKGTPDSAVLKEPAREKFFEDLFYAIEEQYLISFDYQNRHGHKKSHTGLPLKLIQKEHKLHLLVWYPDRGEIRSHRPEYMTNLECKSQTGDYPAGFKIEEYVETAWGTYFNDPLSFAVHISADAADSVVGTYFTRQQVVEPQADGSVIFRATTSGRREVINWILSYGPRAVVLEPADLLAEIRAELQKALNNYHH